MFYCTGQTHCRRLSGYLAQIFIKIEYLNSEVPKIDFTFKTPLNMKKILLGALVCAAVAGVVYYLYDEEKFKATVDDLKDKADGALGKVKEKLSKHKDEFADAI